MTEVAAAPHEAEPQLERQLEQHRRELTGYCYRMLGSSFEADDAVQETMVRAWRSHDRFEGRSSLRSWLYRIATNVCLDMLGRPQPPSPAHGVRRRGHRSRGRWATCCPSRSGSSRCRTAACSPRRRDPAELTVQRESIRLAFMAALQHLPPRQRVVLILREVLRWKADEVAALLGSTVASVNSALQRARATMDASGLTASDVVEPSDEGQRELLEPLPRRVRALRPRRADGAARRGRHAVHAAVPAVDARAGQHPAVAAGLRAGRAGAPGCCRRSRTARPRSASTARAPAAGTRPGRCR